MTFGLLLHPMSNQLRLIIDTLTSNFLSLKDKVLSNKTGRGIGVTRMEEALVPHEHDMEVISHHDPIAYGK
jgi:hypothetical protein